MSEHNTDRMPGFAERERSAQAAWKLYTVREAPISHDFRAAYHRGLIDGFRRGENIGDDHEAITDESLWDFAGELLDAWNIEDTNEPSLIENFRDRFAARFGEPPSEKDLLR